MIRYSHFHRGIGRCLACQLPARAGQGDLCRQCRADLLWCETAPVLADLDQVLCALHYEGTIRDWILRLKFRGDLAAGRVLGQLLAATVRGARAAGSPLPQALLPVPMTRLQWLRRGRNPARVIAAPVARAFALPIACQLAVIAHKPSSQHRLNRAERLQALRGAFCIRGRPPAQVAIVDDVLTTGATAQALARALRVAGCRRVEIWTAAYTLPPEAVP